MSTDVGKAKRRCLVPLASVGNDAAISAASCAGLAQSTAMVPHAPGPHEAADNAPPHPQRFDLRGVSVWISRATQKNRVLSLTLYVAVPAAKLTEIVNLEAIPRNITGGGNWVALRDSFESAVKRYWGHVR